MKRTVKNKNTVGCSSQLAMKKPQTDHKATIFFLPVDLIIEILSRIASHSHIDLFHAKISCKTFYNLAENERIYKQILLERFPRAQWRNREQYCSFISRCVESGNPEALFREGVREYFNKMNMESPFHYLRKAVASGHHGASYILGIILLCTGDEVQQQEGMQLVENLKRNKRLGECREQTNQVLKNVVEREEGTELLENIKRNKKLSECGLEAIIKVVLELWLQKKIKAIPNSCPMQEQHQKKEQWLEENGDEVEISCPECSCDRDLVWFTSLLGLKEILYCHETIETNYPYSFVLYNV